MMQKKKVYGALAVALTTTIAVSACAQNGGGNGGSKAVETQDSSQASKMVNNNPQDRANMEQGGTLTLAIAQMPANWNTSNGDGNLTEISAMLQATNPMLFDYKPDGTVTNNPDFLTKMPEVKEEGGKEVVTYSVNPKAKWNDGSAIDATAFEATWKAQRAPMDKEGYNNVSTAGYEDIEKVEKGAGDTEVKVTFKKKFYPVTEVFKTVLHPKLAGTPDAFNKAMTNDQVHNEWRANAFVIDKVDGTNKTVTLAPNPKWWGQKPMLDKIIYRQMEDSATIPAFKNGELDATGVANKSRFQQIQGAPNMDIRRGQRLADVVYNFNSKAEGLKDVNVRKALWQAFDRAEWKKIRFDGLNWSEPDLGSNLYFGFQPEYEDNYPVKASVQDAQKTLTDAGYAKGADGFFAKDGKKLTVKLTSFGDDPMTTALATLAKNQGKAAGIDVALDIRPSAAFSDAMVKKDFGIVQMAYTPDSNTPLTSVFQLMASTSPNNLSFAGTKELDARIAKIGEISDLKAQAKEINAIEKEWMAATYGTMPIASGPIITAYRKGLANYGPQLFKSLNVHWENVGWQKGMKKG